MLDRDKLGDNPTKNLLVELIRPLLKDAISEALSDLKASNESAEEDVIGIDWVIAYTGKARQTIYQMSSAGTIPCWHLGRKLFFSKEVIREWVKNGGK